LGRQAERDFALHQTPEDDTFNVVGKGIFKAVEKVGVTNPTKQNFHFFVPW
jgi:hypothetical protein